MVSSIIPGTAGANALGVDQRYARSTAPPPRREQAAPGDRVELSAASLSASRDSVKNGLAQIHQALAIGHDAQTMLVQIQALAREGGADVQDQVKTLLDAFAQRLESAISGGAKLVAGGDLAVQAEPDATPVAIAGVDLTVKDEPGEANILQVASSADPATLAQAAQKSLEALQEAMSRLLDAAKTLEAHQGFLNAADGASVRHDLDADGARLMALQVRQGLDVAPGASIANVEPQAVLALFRESA